MKSIEGEVERRLVELLAAPHERERYGVSDEAELRRLLTLEVQTEWARRERESSPQDEAEEGQERLRDRFELQRTLGRGAQGKTYLGLDWETDQQVAVKELILRDVEDWKAIELFEREGQALRFLDHPGIPGYVDAFHLREDGDERFFLVQEFVDGTDLETLIHQGVRTTEREAKRLLEELLEVLIYLQECSPPVVHRDIKPSNIMRRKDGSVALIDFGAVQSVIPNARGGSTIIGTSGYMPIEQLMGRAGPATDIYALGATIIHLLSRRHPADLPMRELRIEFEDAVAVSSRFKEYLRKMTEPREEERFGSAREALRALRELERPEPAPEVSPAPARSAELPARRERPQPEPTEETVASERHEEDDSEEPLMSGTLIAFLIAPVIFLFVGLILLLGGAFSEGSSDQRRCRDGNGSACVQWALQAERSGDVAEAERINSLGCDLNSALACSNQGILALRRGDVEAALEPMEKGCVLEWGTACTNLAYLGYEYDPDRAWWAGERACRFDEALGCANYARLHLLRYVQGDPGDEADLQGAARYAEQGCEGSSESGCYRLALARLYEQDVEAARRAARRAITLNEDHPYSHKAMGLAMVLGGEIEEGLQSFGEARRAASDPGGRERPTLSRPVEETIKERLESLRPGYREQSAEIDQALMRLEEMLAGG